MTIDTSRQIGCSSASQGGYSARVLPSPVGYQPAGANSWLFLPSKSGSDWIIQPQQNGTDEGSPIVLSVSDRRLDPGPGGSLGDWKATITGSPEVFRGGFDSLEGSQIEPQLMATSPAFAVPADAGFTLEMWAALEVENTQLWISVGDPALTAPYAAMVLSSTWLSTAGVGRIAAEWLDDSGDGYGYVEGEDSRGSGDFVITELSHFRLVVGNGIGSLAINGTQVSSESIDAGRQFTGIDNFRPVLQVGGFGALDAIYVQQRLARFTHGLLERDGFTPPTS
jgi:hypothetical protein